MDADQATTSAQCGVSTVIPEVEFYAYLIVLIFLCDSKQYQLVGLHWLPPCLLWGSAT